MMLGCGLLRCQVPMIRTNSERPDRKVFEESCCPSIVLSAAERSLYNLSESRQQHSKLLVPKTVLLLPQGFLSESSSPAVQNHHKTRAVSRHAVLTSLPASFLEARPVAPVASI